MTTRSPSDPAIVLEGLTKRYGALWAVRNLTLEVRRGEIFGFLGLNGAGKTTTLRILLDLLRPTAGEAWVLGRNCQREGLEVRRRVGYLPGEINLSGSLTGRAVLDLLARLGGQPVRPDYRRELQQRLQFSDADLDRKWREYSTGMKRKIGLIQAAQSEPELLVLDEPTEGLDPLAREAMHQLLRDLQGGGCTVFLSSHVLSEVEKICDRIGVLCAGELVLQRGISELRTRATRRMRLVFSAPVVSLPPLPSGWRVAQPGPQVWALEVCGEVGPFLAQLAHLPLRDLELEEPRLEDVTRAYYQGRSPDSVGGAS